MRNAIMFKRILGPTNRKVRVLVGLVLLALIGIQCVSTGDSSVRIIATKAKADDPQQSHEQIIEKLRQLAKTDHVAVLQYCLKNCKEKYGDFTCTFIKQERIGGKVGPEQEMRVKHRVEPFSVSMAWTKNSPQGDRVLYVEGMYDNKMLVRPTNPIARALVGGMVQRQPDGEEAMANTLRPVNMFGFRRGIQSLIDVYLQAKKAGDLVEAVDQDYDVNGHKTLVLVRHLPEGKDYPAHETRIYIDQETLLPIMVEGCGPRGMETDFVCRYLYKDLEFKKLADQDFLPEKNDLVAPK
jgi:hypothetical protein